MRWSRPSAEWCWPWPCLAGDASDRLSSELAERNLLGSGEDGAIPFRDLQRAFLAVDPVWLVRRYHLQGPHAGLDGARRLKPRLPPA